MRISIFLVLFLIFFNSGAALLQTAGVADTHGLNTETGSTSEINESKNEANKISGDDNGPLGGTLFGMINAISTGLGTIVDVIFPGATMIKNIANMPIVNHMINYLFSGMSIVIGIDVARFLRGGGI